MNAFGRVRRVGQGPHSPPCRPSGYRQVDIQREVETSARLFPQFASNVELGVIATRFDFMQTYKTTTGTKHLNEFVKLGWRVAHIFTKTTEFTDDGLPAQSDAAFVVVWDLPGEPVMPKSPTPPTATPIEPCP